MKASALRRPDGSELAVGGRDGFSANISNEGDASSGRWGCQQPLFTQSELSSQQQSELYTAETPIPHHDGAFANVFPNSEVTDFAASFPQALHGAATPSNDNSGSADSNSASPIGKVPVTSACPSAPEMPLSCSSANASGSTAYDRHERSDDDDDDIPLGIRYGLSLPRDSPSDNLQSDDAKMAHRQELSRAPQQSPIEKSKSAGSKNGLRRSPSVENANSLPFATATTDGAPSGSCSPLNAVKTEEDRDALPSPLNRKSEEKKRVSVRKRPATDKPTEGGVRKRFRVLTEENFEPINTWWEKDDSAAKTDAQWDYLEHHGVLFTPAYVPHGLAVRYKNESVTLPPQAEEVANYWCAAMDSPYGTKNRFIDNFWEAFINKLPRDHLLRKCKAKFDEVDFSDLKKHVDVTREAERERKKALTKEERETEKNQKLKEEGGYMYALVDWLREKVGNYRSEPPSLFRGRGEHPKMGMLKRRIFPEEVILNCHENAPVPKVPDDMIGHCWKDVYHDNSVSWLAYYKDSINNQFKYVFLGAGSAVKGQSDHMKYEKARKLKHHIEDIRKDYRAKLKSSDVVQRQLGTATYLIDVLALRVGNEKDQKEEADTVGCCSLRVEHISFDEEASTITLDFLGKDSIRYLNTVKLEPIVLRNLKGFCKNKKPDSDIFDSISTNSLNKYLRDMMPGLSAKVFRTYNASVTLQQELDKLDPALVDISNPDAVKRFYEDANRAVAILCNHQRSVPKSHEASMNRLQNTLDLHEAQAAELEAYIAHSNGKRKGVFKWSPPKKEKDDEDPLPYVSLVKEGMKVEQATKKLETLKSKMKRLEINMKMKESNKTVANSTSKQHYMDPRITVAFCKKWEIPIEKMFNATLRKKFPWAMYARSDYTF